MQVVGNPQRGGNLSLHTRQTRRTLPTMLFGLKDAPVFASGGTAQEEEPVDASLIFNVFHSPLELASNDASSQPDAGSNLASGNDPRISNSATSMAALCVTGTSSVRLGIRAGRQFGFYCLRRSNCPSSQEGAEIRHADGYLASSSSVR